MGLLLKGHFRREESQQIRTKSGEAGVHPEDSIGRGEKVEVRHVTQGWKWSS